MPRTKKRAKTAARRAADVPSADAQRKADERLLRNCCAWCCQYVSARAPVIGVHATLQGEPDLAEIGGLVLAITIGDRAVPGSVAEPGSLAALTGCHIGFLVCSKTCARALRRAIAEEQWASEPDVLDAWREVSDARR